MTRWSFVVIVVGFSMATACARRAPRSGSYVWQLRGAVLSTTDTTLRVRHKSGQIVEMQIDDRTAFIRNKQPDSWQSLSRGTRVMVDVETIQRGVYRARQVQMFGGGRP